MEDFIAFLNRLNRIGKIMSHMRHTVCVGHPFQFPCQLMVLFQSIRHQDFFEVFMILFGMAAVPSLLILIHNNLQTWTEFTSEMHSHIAFIYGVFIRISPSFSKTIHAITLTQQQFPCFLH